MSAFTRHRSEAAVAFPNWEAALAAEPGLSVGQRAGYRQAVVGFLAFCAGRGVPPSVVAAREHVELERLGRLPGPGRLQEWKDALNWYFRRGRLSQVDLAGGLPGVPPLARSDLGANPWEAAFIAHLRQRGRSWRTEQTYRGWLWRFARFLGNRSPADAGAAEVKAFLSRLAVEERVSAATQKQALNAVVVYLRDVEGRELGDFGDFARARKRVRVPVVLNRTECERLFDALEATPRLMAELMFGSGLRLTELLRLRVKDVDLERGQLIVRGGKGFTP